MTNHVFCEENEKNIILLKMFRKYELKKKTQVSFVVTFVTHLFTKILQKSYQMFITELFLGSSSCDNYINLKNSPFTAQIVQIVPIGQNFNLINNLKISYKRCVYESVDDRSLFYATSHKSTENRMHAVKGLCSIV